MKQEVIVFDLETDSPDTRTAHIIEVGAVSIDISTGSILGEYETLVRSDRPIPPEVSAVNHITNQDLEKDGVAGGKVVKEFYDFIADRPVAAHNSKFDLEVTKTAFSLVFNHNLCTMRLAKHLLPELGTYSLQFLRYKLGIDVEGSREERAKAHTALCDARLTAKLLYYLWQHYLVLNPRGSYWDIEKLASSIIDIPVCPFPKHKGKPWQQIPKDYIRWCLDNVENLDLDLRGTMEKALRR